MSIKYIFTLSTPTPSPPLYAYIHTILEPHIHQYHIEKIRHKSDNNGIEYNTDTFILLHESVQHRF